MLTARSAGSDKAKGPHRAALRASRFFPERHTWAVPPSTNNSTPVTKLLSSEARNSATLAISSGGAHPPQRNRGGQTRLDLVHVALGLAQAVQDGRVDRAGAEDVHPDLPPLNIRRLGDRLAPGVEVTEAQFEA